MFLSTSSSEIGSPLFTSDFSKLADSRKFPFALAGKESIKSTVIVATNILIAFTSSCLVTLKSALTVGPFWSTWDE